MNQSRRLDKELAEIQKELGCPTCHFGDEGAMLGFPMCSHMHPKREKNSTQPDEPKQICFTYKPRKRRQG